MVAASGALDLGTAHGAEDNALRTRAPALKLLIHRVLAARAVPVPILTTAEANCMLTLRAEQFFSSHASSNHVTLTLRLRAKSY